MKTTMFYDGGCPLCRREVEHYRRIDRARRVDWVDITRQPDRLEAAGLGPDAAMSRLHAFDREGRLVVGVSAFVAVWHALPYYRHLARAVEALRLVGVLDWLYEPFAKWRLRRRCREGVCTRSG